MGLPTKKLSKHSKRTRAAHFALKKISFSRCSHCKHPVLPHHACEFCGFYKEKQVLKIKTAK